MTGRLPPESLPEIKPLMEVVSLLVRVIFGPDDRPAEVLISCDPLRITVQSQRGGQVVINLDPGQN